MQLPPAFIQILQNKLGDGIRLFQQAFEEPLPISIRLNPFKPVDRFEGLEQVPWYPLGKYLPERLIFTLDPHFHAGTYYVQEASSMAIYQAVYQSIDLSKSQKVLDLCAAPGGKTTLLASVLSSNSFLLANEVIKSRIAPLRQNLAKWGTQNYMVSNHDPQDFSKLTGFFDVVLVDAPCSGEGLFRKYPKAVKEWSLEQVGHCSARQKRILTEALELVKEGGVLIYSTCTYNEKENDQNIKWLLKQGFFEPLQLTLPQEWGILQTQFGYQFYPGWLKGEGFFMSVLKKHGSKPDRPNKKGIKNEWPYLPKKDLAVIEPWIENPQHFSFFLKPNNEIVAVPKELEEIFLMAASSLKRRSFGISIGTIKQNKLIPSHEFALSHIVHKNVKAIDLDLESAIRFLKKESFEMNATEKGWRIVQYQGHNLGWVKLVGSRFNNYLPNEWRIRRF